MKLTGKEKQVLRTLWASDKPMVASEITKEDDSLNINTVQVSLRNLLRKGCVEVADIVYSGTVLSRSYRTVVSEEDLMVGSFMEDVRGLFGRVSTPRIVATFLEQETDKESVIKELEQLLEDEKKLLNK